MAKFSILTFLTSAVFLISFSAWSQCSNVPVVEAVRNGDFEAGYLTKSGTGHTYTANGPFDFQSDLTSTSNFAANPPMGTCLSSIGNQYAVGKAEPGMTCTASPRQAFAGTDYINVNFNDHTPGKAGNGFALIGDFEGFTGGKWDTHASGLPSIWRQRVTIYPNQKYYFSAWFANYNRDAALGGYTNPVLNFVVVPIVSGVPQFTQRASVGTATPSGQMSWQQFYGTWTPSGIYTEAMILIEVLAANATFRNDLVIDDISFINGCNNLTALPASSTPNLGTGFSLCTTDGTATLVSNVATSATTQFWWYSGTASPQTELVSASTTANTLAITAPGTYRVCTQNAGLPAGCSASSTIVVTATMPPVTVNDAVLCSSTTTTLSSSVTGTGFTYNWYKRPTGAPTSTSSTLTTGVTGTYGLRITPGAGAQAIGCATVTSNDAQVTSNISTPAIVSSNCSSAPSGTFNLSATGSGNTFTWYNASTGGTVVGSGNPVSIPITAATTVYVENSTTYTAAPLRADATADDGGGGDTWNSTHFTAAQNFTLVSVWVKSAYGSGPVTLNLAKDGVANTANVGPISLTQGTWRQITLNWPIVAGSSYVITYTTANRLAIRNSFPSTAYSGMVTLNPNTNGTSGAAIEWTIRTGSPCLRGSVALDCPLPVSLSMFEVKALAGNTAEINWSTVSEINNAYFIIEKSKDGKNFEPIGRVEGQGNSTAFVSYQFIDEQTGSGIIYYRLKQVDFDGTSSYSAIKSINIVQGSNISIYPNPTHGSFTISTLQGGSYTIKITDIVGQTVYETEVHSESILDKNIQVLLAKGTYLVQVTSGSTQSVTKLLVE